MLRGLEPVTESELRQWIRSSIEAGSNVFGSGYQSHVYIFEREGKRLIIKTPFGWGLARLFRLRMLRNEYRVYSRLSGVQGVPGCYGLLDGRYLVMDLIEGASIRSAEITDRDYFFESLLRLIQDLHRAGVAHMDLKKKDNLLVVDGKIPYVIDFGVAVVKKPGFAPLNRYLYNLAGKFDYNAWVKLKYGGNFEDLSEEDEKYYNRTVVERTARWIKARYLRVKKAVKG